MHHIQIEMKVKNLPQINCVEVCIRNGSIPATQLLRSSKLQGGVRMRAARLASTLKCCKAVPLNQTFSADQNHGNKCYIKAHIFMIQEH